MPQELNKQEILETLTLLSEWLEVKHPGDVFELTLVGGAALALDGFKDQTRDIDLLWPETLPAALENGVVHISKAKRLSPEWMNTNAANILRDMGIYKKLPVYFNEISRTINIGDNLTIKLIGRQALIALKLFAATPSYTKHTVDIKNLNPNKNEIKEAVRFVLSIDNNELRKNDLRIVLGVIGFDFNEIIRNVEE